MKKKIFLFIGITMFAYNVGLFRPLTYRTNAQKKSALHVKTAISMANGNRTFENSESILFTFLTEESKRKYSSK